MAALDPDQPFSQRVLHLKSRPVAFMPEQETALKRIYGVKIHNAGFVLYPQFQTPCDVFSFGMLIFRALVVNDDQGIGDVSLALEQIKSELHSIGGLEYEEGQENEFWEALIEGHRRGNFNEVFDRSQIFQSRDDRYPDRPNAIPRTLWTKALTLGLQLITNIEGFSYCAHHGDYDARHVSAKMELIARRCEAILREIDAELFSMTRRNAEVRAALDSILNEGAR
jgi:hypothetical protein